ncbi:MAG: ParA family protein [Planctomycetes bacterium]|nr:ParA family protein [Planctomycetota bacterium]
MSTRIAMIGASGGAGRTTLALNLGIVLARSGRSAAIVDLAPQGGLGHVLAQKDWQFDGLADCLVGATDAASALRRSTVVPGFDLLFRGRLDPRDEPEFEARLAADGALASVLAPLDGHDLQLLDTPTGLGALTRAALRASDRALVVFEPTPLGLRSAMRAARLVRQVHDEENPELRLIGFLPSKVDPQARLQRRVLEHLRESLPGLLPVALPLSEACLSASFNGCPFALHPSADAGLQLALEALARILARDEVLPTAQRPADHAASAHYTRLAAMPRAAAPPWTEEELREALAPTEGLFGPSHWSVLLHMCLKVPGASYAFVLDSSGLGVASVGAPPEDSDQELGVRLVVALEQATRMGHFQDDSARIAIDLGDAWMTAFGATLEDGEAYALGVLGDEPVPSHLGRDIGRAFQEVLGRPFGSAAPHAS